MYVACPDDALYIALAHTYADANPRMRLSSGDPSFTNGICNGAQWYCIYGGMQDWNYVWPRCFDTTIELDDQKIPLASRLPSLWTENMTSMLAYAEWALCGVRGIVTDDFSGQPVAAMVTVSNTGQAVFTDPAVGDYHRMLLTGTYTLTFSADNYDPETIADIEVTTGAATRVDVGLTAMPEGGVGIVIGYSLLVIRKKRTPVPHRN
jgi:carboxypeptidase D